MSNWLFILICVLGYLLIGFITITLLTVFYGQPYLSYNEKALVLAFWPALLVFAIIYVIFYALIKLSEKISSEVWRHRRNQNKSR